MAQRDDYDSDSGGSSDAEQRRQELLDQMTAAPDDAGGGGQQGITDPPAQAQQDPDPPAPATPDPPAWSEQHPDPAPAPAPAPLPAQQPQEAPAPAPAPAPAAAPATNPYAGGPYPGDPSTGSITLPSAVANIYRTALGREGSVEDIQAWIAGTQGNLAAIQQGIYASPEAQAYSASRSTAATPPAGTTPAAGARPTGGQLTDPAYAAKYVQWAGTQPGVNPSVKNDPNYWIGRFTSGAFGNDQDYALMRMLQPEGPPEGSQAAPPRATTPPPAVTTPPPVAAPAAAAGYQAPPAPPSAGASGGTTNGSTAQAFGGDIRNQLLNLLQQAPVSETDADVAPAITAYRNSRMRALRETQDQNAESANARGLLHSGAYDAATSRDNELAGGDIASFAGNAVQQQATARRNQITQLLQTGAGILTADQQNALQAQVANIDAYLRQQGITNQANQFNASQYQQGAEFSVTANNNALRTALGL